MFRTKLLSFAAHNADGLSDREPEPVSSGEDPGQSGPIRGSAGDSEEAKTDAAPAAVSAAGEAAPASASATTKSKTKAKSFRSKSIDKAVLTHPEPRRIRDRDHVRFVAQQPCLVCGRQPCDPHHLRFAQDRALSRKVSDEFTVPLCRGHHRELHRHGDEAAWWSKAAIDPLARARELWRETHPLPISAGQSAINVQTEQPYENITR
jgi:hypothetical protein